ncbi:SEC-C metal-binding domain-containing protein [Hydrogenophaga sp. A37]
MGGRAADGRGAVVGRPNRCGPAAGGPWCAKQLKGRGRCDLDGLQPARNLEGPGPARRDAALAVAGRNDACPCGSAKKFKKCCG